MKTVEELYTEIMSDAELRMEWFDATDSNRTDSNRIEKFLRKHDCSATLEEVEAFLKAKNDGEDSISLDELNLVAGGKEEHQCNFGRDENGDMPPYNSN